MNTRRDPTTEFQKSWQTILSRQVGQTRQIFRTLFNGDRLPFIPMTNDAGSQYEFNGTASIGRLLVGCAKALVSPAEFSKGATDPLGFQIDVKILAA